MYCNKNPSEQPENETFTQLKISWMDDVETKPVNWLWKDRISLGNITVLGGPPGAGKSFFTCDIASRISRGMGFPDNRSCERGKVLIVTTEDSLEQTISPRLDAHRAVRENIGVIDCIEVLGGKETREINFTLAHADLIAQAIQTTPDIKLLVVDPIGSFIGGDTDSDKDNKVRSILAPVAKIAEDHQVAILLVAHWRKARGETADSMIMGSRAFTGIARTTWHLIPDPEERGERKLFLQGKNNLAKLQDGLAFTIEGEGQNSSLYWESGAVRLTADQGLAIHLNGGKKSRSTPKQDEAEDWLVSFLAGGPVPAAEVIEAADEADIKEKTLRRAKTNLGVKSVKSEFRGSNVWTLPNANDGHLENTPSATIELNGHDRENHESKTRETLEKPNLVNHAPVCNLNGHVRGDVQSWPCSMHTEYVNGHVSDSTPDDYEEQERIAIRLEGCGLDPTSDQFTFMDMRTEDVGDGADDVGETA